MKACEWKRKLAMAFLDLEKVYERVNREGLSKLLKMYGVNSKLL